MNVEVCTWCHRPAVKGIVVQPPVKGSVPSNTPGGKLKTIVRAQRFAPACAACAKRVQTPIGAATQPIRRGAQIAGQMDVFDCLAAVPPAPSEPRPAPAPTSGPVNRDEGSQRPAGALRRAPTPCPACGSTRTSVTPAKRVVCFACNHGRK